MAEPQTEMRMTRSRAKALATPGAGLTTTKAQAKTTAKTTSRKPRRTQTDVRPEEDTKPQQLFKDEHEETKEADAPETVVEEPVAVDEPCAESADEPKEPAAEDPAATTQPTASSQPAEWSSGPSSPESMQALPPTQQDEQRTPVQPMPSLDTAMDSAASEGAEDACAPVAAELAAASPAAEMVQEDDAVGAEAAMAEISAQAPASPMAEVAPEDIAAAMADVPDDVSDVLDDEAADDMLQSDEMGEMQASEGEVEAAVAEITADTFEAVVQEAVAQAEGLDTMPAAEPELVEAVTAVDEVQQIAAADEPMQIDEAVDSQEPKAGNSVGASMAFAAAISAAPAEAAAQVGFGGFSVVEHPVAGSPAVVRKDAKTPKTKEAKTAGKKVGFGSSSVTFWQVSDAVPKTPGFTTTALAGATPASRKTGGTAKRVSIATPQPSKSTGPKAPVVRTPYPKSSEKPSSEEADDVEESERAEEEEETGLVMALSTEIGMDVDVPASGSSTPAPGAASASDAAAMTPEFQPLPKSVVKSATKPVRPASAAPAASKYQQAQAALKSLARAEADTTKPAPAPVVRPSTAPSNKAVPGYLMPTKAATLKSKVVVPEDYDARSLGQLRREIKQAEQKKLEKQSNALKEYGLEDVRDAPSLIQPVHDSQDLHEDDGEAEAAYDKATEDVLVKAMGGLAVDKTSKVEPLKGLPLPQGNHIRFGAKGKAQETTATKLRGLPTPQGKHKRFD